jgi:NitT/TauT family transport system substrate-binding protein
MFIFGGIEMKRFCIILAALIFLCLMLTSCGGDTGLTRVKLSEVTHSVFYAPQYVALNKGFFKEAGLEIELQNGQGADRVMTAVLSGQCNIGLAGPEASIYVYNEGKADYARVFAS